MENCKMMTDFTNLYSVSKTIRNELIPIGKTLEHIQREGILTEDEERSEAYQQVKFLVDAYHRDYLEEKLSQFDEDWESIIAAIRAFRKVPSDDNKKILSKLQSEKRKAISKCLTKGEQFKRMFGKEMYEDILPAYLKGAQNITEEERSNGLAMVGMFHKFSTYFTNFHKNRENTYSADEKFGSVGYRIVHENLYLFVDNMSTYQIILTQMGECLNELEEEQKDWKDDWTLGQIFSAPFFNYVLSQKGIDFYNQVVGTINKASNLFCQKHDEFAHLAKKVLLKPLYKQILSITSSRFELPEKLQSDDAVKALVHEFVKTIYDNDIEERVYLWKQY